MVRQCQFSIAGIYRLRPVASVSWCWNWLMTGRRARVKHLHHLRAVSERPRHLTDLVISYRSNVGPPGTVSITV
jgi:hypothetical protein